MIHDLHNLLRSGRVKRWHQHPDMCDCGENNAQHQWEVAMIALTIEPSLTLAEVVYALTHDAGEMKAGDLSYDFKRDNPELATAHKGYEHRCRLELVEGAGLSVTALLVVRAADWFAARHTMLRHAPWLRHREDWEKQFNDVIDSLTEEQMRRIGPWIVEIDTWCDERGV